MERREESYLPCASWLADVATVLLLRSWVEAEEARARQAQRAMTMKVVERVMVLGLANLSRAGSG